jgi:hypothetical protein
VHDVLVEGLSLLEEYARLVKAHLVIELGLLDLLDAVRVLVQIRPGEESDAVGLREGLALHDLLDLVVQ